ncbi:MAG: GIY-YIG nuclease family protein [Marinirhabdus sp.]|nr:GIY-YIG nuclease family protein [Marinirhabdus sp.]
MVNEVYILYSKKLERFYIGQTSNFEKRMAFHKRSLGNKFTGKANDWILFLRIGCDSRKQAFSLERHIKRMKSKQYIVNLSKYPDIIDRLKRRYSE